MSALFNITGALLNAVFAAYNVGAGNYPLATLNACACMIMCALIAGSR